MILILMIDDDFDYLGTKRKEKKFTLKLSNKVIIFIFEMKWLKMMLLFAMDGDCLV